MHHLCADLLDRFKALIASVMSQLPQTSEGGAVSVDAVEVLGGGVRMPVVQQTIAHFVGEHVTLGAKLDDGAIALGAALLFRRQQNDLIAAAAKPATDVTPIDTAVPMEVEGVSEEKQVPADLDVSIGLSGEEIAAAKDKERHFQSGDDEVRELRRAYNQLEAYILEMRNAPRRKHGELINSSQLSPLLDEYEQWLWDVGTDDLTTVAVFQAKYQELTEKVTALCQAYFTKVNEEKEALEKLLQEEALKAQQEKEDGGEDEDHDNRKLKKNDRMRLVVKNKDEGNELFKGGNYRMAAARYHKALTHSSKFFDLGPDDEAEVKTLKISLYNNLATCYLKLENYEQMGNNVKEVLKLDEKNVKALFRYSQYYENKKEWEKCLELLNQCQSLNTTEDKLVTKNIEKVKKEIAKLKDKEKKMWGKAFA